MRTSVDLTWQEGRIERWLRFGRVAEDLRLSRTDRRVSLDPGAIFALVRWASNGYATVESRVSILRAVAPGEACTTHPFVAPGAEILLRLHGWPKVARALEAIDQVDAAGIAPEEACPDHWRHVQNRLAARLPPRPYTPRRHAAWLRRRELVP